MEFIRNVRLETQPWETNGGGGWRKVYITIHLKDVGFEDGQLRGIVSEKCSKAGFDVSCVETSGSTALVLVG
jgi:hypothetical protein